MEHLEASLEFLKYPWFTRGWIVQELILSSNGLRRERGYSYGILLELYIPLVKSIKDIYEMKQYNSAQDGPINESCPTSKHQHAAENR